MEQTDLLEQLAQQLGITPGIQSHEEEIHRVHLSNGRYVDVTAVQTEISTGADNNPVVKTIHSQPLFADGLSYRPELTAGYCSQCLDEYQQQKIEDIRPLSVHSAYRCSKCLKILCPAHAKIVNDNTLLCPPCRNKLKWKNIWHFIFILFTFPLWFFIERRP